MERKRSMNKLIFCVSLFYIIKGAHSAQWTISSPTDGHRYYGCQGEGVTLAWQYAIAVGQQVGEVTWLYTGSSQEVIAVQTHGLFIPMAPFSNRVKAVGNAGISLSNLQAADTGNYSVEVQIFSNGGTTATILRRHAIISISEHLMTTDGLLHAVQDSEAVLDPNSNLLSIQLSCGSFLYVDNPPIFVEWVTPTDKVENSTSYSDHHFHLLLPFPVQGGQFTCRIPPQHAATVCLPANDTRSRETHVTVNKNDAMFSLMAKEIQILKQELQDEKHKTSNISDNVVKLENATRPTVAFHATSISNYRTTNYMPIVFSNVVFNTGGSYSASTGQFTAPFAGVYVFIATTAGYDYQHPVSPILFAGNTQVGAVTATATMATQHAVIHLNKGDIAWVRADGNMYGSGYNSMFSGFLLSQDV